MSCQMPCSSSHSAFLVLLLFLLRFLLFRKANFIARICQMPPVIRVTPSPTFLIEAESITSLRLIVCLRINNYTIVQHIRGVMIPAQPNFVAFPDTNSGPVKSRMVTNVDVSRCESDDPTSGFLAISHLESHQVNCGTITPLQQQMK